MCKHKQIVLLEPPFCVEFVAEGTRLKLIYAVWERAGFWADNRKAEHSICEKYSDVEEAVLCSQPFGKDL